MLACRCEQARFLQTLTECSYLAKYVQILRWTVLGQQDDYDAGTPEKNRVITLGHYLAISSEGLWRILNMMNQVETIELGHAVTFDKSCPLRSLPENLHLFPSATSITLVGFMDV